MQQLATSFAPDIDRHLAVNRYGDFTLTAGIRPSLDLQVIPREGYRVEVFEDGRTGSKIPMLAASVSMERLFGVFLELLDPLADEVDCILESHHDRRKPEDTSRDFVREHVDLPVLKSYFCDYEDVLMDDGCLAVAVVDPKAPCEIQFDDHKVLVVYAKDLWPFEVILERNGVCRDDNLRLISEGEHLHSTSPKLSRRLEMFRMNLSAQ